MATPHKVKCSIMTLSVVNLSCQRGDRLLFEEQSFDLHSGEWLHIKGANGAGKTSLLRLLAGLAMPHQGKILWNQDNIANHHYPYRQQLLYLGHQSGLKEELTPLENLHLLQTLFNHQYNAQDTKQALIAFGLKGRIHLPCRFLSAGQKRRVSLSRLSLQPSSLWILDEPFTALDTQASEFLTHIIQEHLNQGGITILTSHQPINLTNERTLLL